MTATTQSVRRGIQKVNNTVMLLAYLNSNQTALTASSWNKINLGKVLYDVGKNWDTSLFKFTAPVTGLYKIQAHGVFTSVIATHQYGVAIYQNGSAVKKAYSHSSTTDDVSASASMELFLKQNDTIELYMNPVAGANTVAALSGSVFTSISIRLVTKEGIKQ